MCGSSERSLEASLTGMEFNSNAHCGKAVFWSRQRVTNKMTLRTIHLSRRISELYFVWLRMEIPLAFQPDCLMHQIQGWGFIQEIKKKKIARSQQFFFKAIVFLILSQGIIPNPQSLNTTHGLEQIILFWGRGFYFFICKMKEFN